jgi:hypothetical protein
VPVTLGRLWQLRNQQTGPSLPTGHRGFGALLLAEMSEERRREHAIDASVEGLVVVGLAQDSDAQRKGLSKGDALVLANGSQPLRLLQDLHDQMNVAFANGRDSILVQIHRSGRTWFAALSLYDLDGPYRGTLAPAPESAASTPARSAYQMVLEHEGTGSYEDAAAALIAGVQAGDTAVHQLIDTGATTLSKETRQALQRKLKDAGHYDGTVDGIIGEGTRRALARITTVTP